MNSASMHAVNGANATAGVAARAIVAALPPRTAVPVGAQRDPRGTINAARVRTGFPRSTEPFFLHQR
ncbi:hypothetical protein HT102_09205 [Hoyosella sp. G463]|uniref:Uncharacterized protein n=1 Tax=Lolliginicoccus lacisalsi TaxID=2742202 RepID=A0A927JC95_9ACTN|nr:hypothetical protein [Lolliginicoccus lacisalsi]MBD8506664.1 hypothetical protein [Lolliginicoccus lacisalsi]